MLIFDPSIFGIFEVKFLIEGTLTKSLNWEFHFVAHIWSISVDGGEPRQLFVKPTFLAVFTVGAFTSVVDFCQFSAGKNAGDD